MRQRVLGVKCKTKDCAGVIPLPAARPTVFPSKATVIIGMCRHCHKKNDYRDADVIDTGYEIIVTDQEG